MHKEIGGEANRIECILLLLGSGQFKEIRDEKNETRAKRNLWYQISNGDPDEQIIVDTATYINEIDVKHYIHRLCLH